MSAVHRNDENGSSQPISVWEQRRKGETKLRLVPLCAEHSKALQAALAQPREAADLEAHNEEVTLLLPEAVARYDRSVRRRLRQCDACKDPDVGNRLLAKLKGGS